MKAAGRALALVLAAAASAPAVPAFGEQFRQFGPWRVHYVAFAAAILPPAVAERHGIVRGRNKGLVNVSAVGASGRGEKIAVRGGFLNLLGQRRDLAFREVDEGGSVYYLAPFDFDDAETLRFEIVLELPGRGVETLRFQQPLHFPLR